MDELTRIPVGGDRPYDVLVGRAIGGHLPPLVAGAHRVAVIYPPTLKERADSAAEELRAAGCKPLPIEVPDAEAAKTVDVAEHCWERLGSAGFTRTDAVVGLGGGAVTDLAGFVAACWLRGVRWVPIPTSLLGMVDAAVGGKTAVNTTAGKNLVGAFHPPAGVLCDLSALHTLPATDVAAGLAEVVKCGFIADPVILELVERHDPATLTPDSPVLRELIERAIAVKIDVVVADLKETGGPDGHPGREVLNYGHTMAHAIERASDYTVRHGEAVAIGSVFVAELARLAGVLDDATADRHRTAFERVGLPIHWYGASYDELRDAMAVDKKARGNTLRFVVLSGVGRPQVLTDPADDLLRAAYRIMTGTTD
jgi:3-dehydroquinate synthase